MTDDTLRRSLQSIFERGPVAERTRDEPPQPAVEMRRHESDSHTVEIATEGERGETEWLSGRTVTPEELKSGRAGQ